VIEAAHKYSSLYLKWYRRLARIAFVVLAGYLLMYSPGCTHDPFLVDPIDPIDTMGMDTMPIDSPFVACEDGTIYFEYDVLPILVSNCSVPGCHDAVSHQEDIILTSYASVIASGEVKPFDLNGGKLFEKITDSDPDDRMPPPPRIPLTQAQISTIATWILQGAQDLTCDRDTACSTENVSFSQTVFPILEKNCKGCHSSTAPTGGISLETYTSVRNIAATGRLYGAIARLPGFQPMPRNRGPLADCEILQIKSWIDAGMPDN
jgi:hypothetical protein